MVMEERHGRRGAFRRPARVKGQVVRAGDQTADDQEVLRAAGGDKHPVREPGALDPFPQNRSPKAASLTVSSARMKTPTPARPLDGFLAEAGTGPDLLQRSAIRVSMKRPVPGDRP